MITTIEIENLAKLSRIQLDDSQKDSLTKEVDSIIGYIDQLKKANVTISTEARVGAVKNVTRNDETVVTNPSDREAILNEAPDREGDFVAVKKIIAQG